ncbi:acyltransferase [Colletotrichum incanum]|uniref:Acyltransferase n=1 Tax=Colletotrichum incanum TaxID=1573173 RepID=A0A167BUS6_COLIC|nr:acyltransferase [Colletotrichum incanum]
MHTYLRVISLRKSSPAERMHQFQVSIEAPLDAPAQLRPVQLRPANPRPATSYLDGLRGIAALFVYTYHFSMALEGKRLRHGYGPHNSSLLSLPVLRLVRHSGPAMVSIFFAISGYVLSVGPLRHARRRQWDKLLAYISGAVLTRPIRLFLPSILLTVASLVLACLGYYELSAREMCPPPSPPSSSYSQECDFYPVTPPHLASVRDQVADWFGFVVRDLANPWDWEAGLRPASAYGLHLWTVGAELRCSMALFAVLATLLPCPQFLVRAGLWLALLVFCALWQRWDMVAFLAGLGLAVGDADENDNDTQQDDGGLLESGTSQNDHVPGRSGASLTATAIRRLIPNVSLLASLWLCSYPDVGGHEAWGFRLLASISSDRKLWHTSGAALMLWSTRRVRFIRHLLSSFIMIQFLGRISFALYLVHEPLLQVWGWPWARSWSGAPWALTVLVFIAETCTLLCLASVTWAIVDQRVLRMVKVIRQGLV